MANSVDNQNQHKTLDLPKPKLRCIVKLGGAAITRKNELESINEENLGTVCSQLRKAMTSSPAARVAGMDWSRRKGKPIVASDLDPVTEISEIGVGGDFIVVHGAGSFGHFHASRSGVHKGGLHLPLVKAGFVATRISVTSLNLEIVRALAQVLLQRGYRLLECHHLHVDGQLVKEMLHLLTSLNLSRLFKQGLFLFCMEMPCWMTYRAAPF